MAEIRLERRKACSRRAELAIHLELIVGPVVPLFAKISLVLQKKTPFKDVFS